MSPEHSSAETGSRLGVKGTYQGDTCPLDTKGPTQETSTPSHITQMPCSQQHASPELCRVAKPHTSQSQPECLEIISSNFSPAEIQVWATGFLLPWRNGPMLTGPMWANN